MFSIYREDGLCNPAAWILCWVLGVFTLAAIIHPQEGLNILFFPVYFVAVPAMYMILIIYSMCNLNNISWGTREVPKTAAEKQKEAEILKEVMVFYVFDARLFANHFLWYPEFIFLYTVMFLVRNLKVKFKRQIISYEQLCVNKFSMRKICV